MDTDWDCGWLNFWFPIGGIFIFNHNRKLHISRVPTKAKWQGPDYSQALSKDVLDLHCP